MKLRKLRQPRDGKPKPPLTRLKELPASDRAKVMEILRDHATADAKPLVERQVGFQCSLDALYKFFSWQVNQESLDAQNDMLETFEEFTRKRNPQWTAEKVRQHSIDFLMAYTSSRKDVIGFATIAAIDQRERHGQAKAKFEERKVSVSERRVALLEQKAAQADKAKGVLEDKELTEEQKAARMRELFGIS